MNSRLFQFFMYNRKIYGTDVALAWTAFTDKADCISAYRGNFAILPRAATETGPDSNLKATRFMSSWVTWSEKYKESLTRWKKSIFGYSIKYS